MIPSATLRAGHRTRFSLPRFGAGSLSMVVCEVNFEEKYDNSRLS
jgi:hypothetical protein